MANSRVEFFGETLMDVTDTTATPASVTAGKVFYQADGQRAVGTAAYQPKVFEDIVTLTTTWQGTGPYTQTVMTGQDTHYRVDVTPTPEQLAQIVSDGVTIMQANNVDGSIVVTCVGAVPSVALAMRLVFVYTENGARDPPDPAEYEPKVILISIPLTATWTKVDDKYEQTIVVGENPKYMYDPQPTVAQIEQLQEDGVQAMVFVNTDGTVKAVCIGGTPSTAMTIQGTKTMVYSN